MSKSKVAFSKNKHTLLFDFSAAPLTSDAGSLVVAKKLRSSKSILISLLTPEMTEIRDIAKIEPTMFFSSGSYYFAAAMKIVMMCTICEMILYSFLFLIKNFQVSLR